MNAVELFQPLSGLHPDSRGRRAANDIAAELRHQNRLDVNATLLAKIDRLWRSKSGGYALVAPHYGRALYGQLDKGIPLTLSYNLALQSDDVVTHCVHVENLLLNNHVEWAISYMKELLSLYAVEADGLFTNFLDRFVAKTSIPGWVGHDLSFDPVAGLAPAHCALSRLISSDGKFEFSRGEDDVFRLARFAHPASLADFQLAIDGVPLLQPGKEVKGHATFDSGLKFSDRFVEGSFKYKPAPALMPKIVLSGASDNVIALAKPVRSSFSQWSFKIDHQNWLSRESRIYATASLPRVGRLAFAGSPFFSPRALIKSSKAAGTSVTRKAIADLVTVIVPVFNNLADTVRCLNSLSQSLPDTDGWKVLVIDDHSDEAGAEQVLRTSCTQLGFGYERRAANEGYASAVNDGISACDGDVVLLNSDTVVFPGLLQNLKRTADSRQRVATVTAASTDDTIAGINLARADETQALAWVKSLNQHLNLHGEALPIEVCSGVGHCMYVKRAAIEDIGVFDAELFPSGYGEETDFCFRASRQGWTHLVETKGLIFHAGGKSFSTRKAALLDRADFIMRTKYPDYVKQVGMTVSNPDLKSFKRSIYEYIFKAHQGPLNLVVAPKLIGGVDRAVFEQIAGWKKQGIRTLILHPGKSRDNSEVLLQSVDFGNTVLSYRGEKDHLALQELISWIGFQAIHIHHFVGIPHQIIQYLAEHFADRSTVYIHDYSWACPRINLSYHDGTFCNTPSISECNRCIDRQGSLLREPIAVGELRKRSAELMLKIGHVKSVSADVKLRLAAMLGLNPDQFQDHLLEQQYERPKRVATRARKARVKVALIGAIGVHKGFNVLLSCLEDAKKRRLPLDFVVIGFTGDDAKLKIYDNVSVTGAYRESEAAYLIKRENPDIIFCSSVVPETWCYTLSYPLKMGIPILSFDIGMQAKRLDGVVNAKTLPLGTNPRCINDHFIKTFTNSMGRDGRKN